MENIVWHIEITKIEMKKRVQVFENTVWHTFTHDICEFSFQHFKTLTYTGWFFISATHHPVFVYRVKMIDITSKQLPRGVHFLTAKDMSNDNNAYF